MQSKHKLYIFMNKIMSAFLEIEIKWIEIKKSGPNVHCFLSVRKK